MGEERSGSRLVGPSARWNLGLCVALFCCFRWPVVGRHSFIARGCGDFRTKTNSLRESSSDSCILEPGSLRSYCFCPVKGGALIVHTTLCTGGISTWRPSVFSRAPRHWFTGTAVVHVSPFRAAPLSVKVPTHSGPFVETHRIIKCSFGAHSIAKSVKRCRLLLADCQSHVVRVTVGMEKMTAACASVWAWPLSQNPEDGSNGY